MEAFLEQAGIAYLTPDRGADFDDIQLSHTGHHKSSQPAFITLPNTAAQVAAVVKHCIATDRHFIVRGGGHDCHGRYTTAGAVSIDLRRMSFTTVAPGRKTATIGGGTTVLQLLTALEEQGLEAASPLCGDVGYTGWCLLGGLGPWTSRYGIGSDQIVGALVVNADGEVIEADERLLKGLRGGGGSLGVVVHLVIRVYPIDEVCYGVTRVDVYAATLTIQLATGSLLKLNLQHQRRTQHSLDVLHKPRQPATGPL